MVKTIRNSSFDIEDIHKIREKNYENTRNMTIKEKVEYYNSLGKNAETEINKRKNKIQ